MAGAARAVLTKDAPKPGNLRIQNDQAKPRNKALELLNNLNQGRLASELLKNGNGAYAGGSASANGRANGGGNGGNGAGNAAANANVEAAVQIFGGPKEAPVPAPMPMAPAEQARTLQSSEANGLKTLTAQEEERTVVVMDSPASGVRMLISEVVDGKLTSRQVEAKDKAELKKKYPKEFELYQRLEDDLQAQKAKKKLPIEESPGSPND